MAEAKRDQNRVPTILGVSNVDFTTPTLAYVNPATGALLVDTGGAGSGTVTSVSVVTANGVSGSVATPTTTPAITLTLGAITPTTVNGLTLAAQAIGFTIAGGTTSKTLTVPLDASVSGTNTGDQSLTGLVPYTGATGSVDLGANSLTTTNITQTGFIDFTNLATPANPATNHVRLYSLNTGGISRLHSLQSNGTDFSLLRDSVIRVYNGTGSTINKGSVVYLNGQNGGVPTIALSKADAAATSIVSGIVLNTALTTEYTTVQFTGEAQQLDTSAFNAGDSLWLSASAAGGLTATEPTKPNISVKVGIVLVKDASVGIIYLDVINNPPFALSNLTDVTISSPAVDQFLRYNGTNWVNGAGATSGVGPGIDFFSATPVVISRTSPAGLSQDGTAGNGIQINTLSKTPVTTAEQTQAGLASIDTRAYAAWKYNTALGRTSIDAGVWTFQVYAAVNSATGTNTITRGIYQVVPVSSGTVDTSGVGANSRTATITSGQFTGTYFAPNATNTVASYLETPSGIFQITASGTTNTATITVPTGYVNETGVTFNIWNKLFSQTSADITATGTNYALQTFTTTQPAFTIAATDKFGSISFFTSTVASKTVTTTYNGTARNSFFTTPLVTLHNNLAGLQGGAANEFYHLTSAEYTGSGTGNFARVTSPVFTTPNIGSATGSVSGNAGSSTLAEITDDTTTNATMYPAWVTTASSNQAIKVSSSKMTFNPSTATLTVANFAGNSASSTLAAITDDTTTNATMYPTWVTTASSNQAVKVSSTKMTFNPSTGTLTTTAVASALTGNVTGNITGNQILTPAPGADVTVSGLTATLNANENQGFGDVCYIDADGQAHLADASAIATSAVIAMASASISANADGVYLLHGFARNDAWAWTVGGFIYLTITGTTTNTLTQTAPSGANETIVVLGVATHADRMYFNPQLVIVEHV